MAADGDGADVGAALGDRLKQHAMEAAGYVQRVIADRVVAPATPPRLLRAHGATVTAVALTADAASAFSVAKDGSLVRTDVATGTDAPWSPASGTLPASLSLSQREAEALTAAVAAYGGDQDIYKRKPRRSALAYLAYLAGIAAAVVVNNAIEQNAGFPNDEQKWQRMNTPATGGERARPLDPAPKQRLARIIVKFGSCAGALVSVANRLKTDSANQSLAAFAEAVRDDANWQAVPADADCNRSSAG